MRVSVTVNSNLPASAAKPGAEIQQGQHASGVIADQLPVRVRAALEAKADGFDNGRQSCRNGQGCDRCQQAEEAHSGGLQGGQADPGDEGEATKARGIAPPTGGDGRPLIADRIHHRGRGRAPAPGTRKQ